MHRGQLPTTKNHLVQKLKKARVENLSSTHTDMVFVFVYKEVSTRGLALTEKQAAHSNGWSWHREVHLKLCLPNLGGG